MKRFKTYLIFFLEATDCFRMIVISIICVLKIISNVPIIVRFLPRAIFAMKNNLVKLDIFFFVLNKFGGSGTSDIAKRSFDIDVYIF